MDSLLVLTGVSTAADLLAAPARQRPSHVAVDLRGLFTADGWVAVPGAGAGSSWSVHRHERGAELTGDGTPLAALAALCAAAWESPTPAGTASPGTALDPAAITAGSPAAAAALRALNLD